MKKLFLFLSFLTLSCAHRFLPERFEATDPDQKICFIGDTGKDSSAQTAAALALEYEKCHSIYFLGDIIYPRGLESDTDPAFNKKFLRYYEKLTQMDFKPKLFVIMGNHDHRKNTHAWLEISKKFPFIHFPGHFYLENDRGICLFTLDTEFYNQRHLSSQIAPQQLWLEETLKTQKNCNYKLALTHHPYKSSGTGHGDATGKVRTFIEDKILGRFDGLISGHEHILTHEGAVKGTSLFISGTGADPDRGHFPGYLTLEIDKLGQSQPLIHLKSIMKDGSLRVQNFKLKPVDKN